MLNIKNTTKKVTRSISLKINMGVLLCGILLLIFSVWLLSDSMKSVERQLVNDRLTSDLRCLRDYLGESEESTWHVQNGFLMIGDTALGDGTIENANEELLIHCEEITGTFFSCFVRIDGDLAPDAPAFKRAAISTVGLNGERLEGELLSKSVETQLNSSADGSCSILTKVAGVPVYTRFEYLYDKEGNTVGILSNGRAVAELDEIIKGQKTRAVILIVTGILALLCGLSFVVFSMLRSINKINERLALIGEGNFPEEPLELNTHDELEDVAGHVNAMVESLKEKERLGTELSLATDIQAHMLPSIFPAFPDREEFDIYASMEPAKEVGGDFYDFFMLDSQNLAMVIADVSGKGIPAALFMVITKTLIKNHALMGLTPDQVFTTVNQMLCEGNDADLFVSAWMGVVNLATGKLTYTNAGHNPPVLKKRDGSFEYLRSKPYLVLACMEGIRYGKNELTLQPGDKLVLYTDGVTEATNTANELFGEERLLEFLNANSKEDAKTLLNHLKAEIAAFQGEADQFDDITILTFDYLKAFDKQNLREIEFQVDTMDVKELLVFVDRSLKELHCPEDAAGQISEVLGTVFSNFESYQKKEIDNTAKLYILHEKDGALLVLAQRGFPFDPLSNEVLGEKTSADLGLKEMKKTMDDIHYKYDHGHNILTIKKSF